MGSVNPLAVVPPRRPGVELSRPVALIDRDGSRRSARLSADEQTALWCDVVLSGQAGLVEVVRASRGPDGQLRMRSRRDPAGFIDCATPHAVVSLAARGRGRGEEVFCCPVPKSAAEPGRSSAVDGRVLWVDVDDVSDRATLERLRALRPHLLCHSGGGLHAYWRLAEAVDPDELEALNRRLCHLADGDAACTDRGRIMRVAGSFNARRSRWCRVLEADRSRDLVVPDRLAAIVEDPEPPAPRRQARRAAHSDHDDPLAGITPPEYFRVLCGVDVDRCGGDVRCPLPGHEDRYASCHVWAEPDRGWWCFGCNRGGSAVDLVSVLGGGPCGRVLAGAAFGKAHRGAVRRLT